MALASIKLDTLNTIRPLAEDIRHIAAEIPTVKDYPFHSVKGDCAAKVAQKGLVRIKGKFDIINLEQNLYVWVFQKGQPIRREVCTLSIIYIVVAHCAGQL